MEARFYEYPTEYRTLTAPIVALIVDDHPVVADGLRHYLETSPDIQVAAICYDGETALQIAAEYHPDIVIVDLELDGSRINGIEVARQLRERYQTLKLLVVSAYTDPQRVLSAIGSGVDGYLVKTSYRPEIIQAVYSVMNGTGVWDPQVLKIIRLYLGDKVEDFTRFAQEHYQSSRVTLTDREWELLELIALGHSNRDIASELYIAEGTVRTHVTNILGKLGLKDREQARVWYYINRHLYQ